MPSVNGKANARGMARIAAAVSSNFNGKAFEEKTWLMTTEGAQQAHANPKVELMFGLKSNFTNAGWNIYELPNGLQDRDGSVGWMGLGGSALMWHRELDIGFAYSMNLMESGIGNLNSKILQKALVRCAAKAQEKSPPENKRTAFKSPTLLRAHTTRNL